MQTAVFSLDEQLKFGQDEFEKASDEWGCNCGPSALACALGVSLDEVRPLIPEFEQRGYTSPTMMNQALSNAGVGFRVLRDDWPILGLVRIQWCGPWTEPGANPKWAYRQTHWIASIGIMSGAYVFDCNGGMRTRLSWEQEIVPLLTQHVKRCNGDWYPTHRWELSNA